MGRNCTLLLFISIKINLLRREISLARVQRHHNFFSENQHYQIDWVFFVCLLLSFFFLGGGGGQGMGVLEER